jgi:RHS repeat-associated protein
VTDETRFGSDTTGTVWDGFDPVATDSGLHGVTDLLRDPTGGVVLQDGAYENEWILGDMRNATATADAGGQITDLVDYADFGGADYESTGWGSLVGNDGQPGDATLGLDHYYARDYDTTTGSWVQPDEWRGLLVRPQSLNRFAYVENSPVAFSDHLGFAAKKAGKIGSSGGLKLGLSKSVVNNATGKGGIAAASAAANGGRVGQVFSKAGVASPPRTKVQSPWIASTQFLSNLHLLTATGCDHMDKNCRGGNGNLFGWSDETWRNIGAAALATTITLVAAFAIAGTAACGLLTFGACALVVGVIAGAVAGAAAYGFTTEPKDRTAGGYAGSAGAGAVAGLVGGIAGLVAGRVVTGLVGRLGSGSTQPSSGVVRGPTTSQQPGSGVSGLTGSQQKSLTSLQQRLNEHVQKLESYRANPDLYDNRGLLANAATPEIRQSIINGRIKHLETEIKGFQQQINALRDGPSLQ